MNTVYHHLNDQDKEGAWYVAIGDFGWSEPEERTRWGGIYCWSDELERTTEDRVGSLRSPLYPIIMIPNLVLRYTLFQEAHLICMVLNQILEPPLDYSAVMI